MSKIIYQDKTFLQELAEIPEINKVTDNNMNSIKKAVNENGQYVSATESNGEFTCTLEGSISQNDIVHILFDTNSTATPASLSVDGGNTFLNILDASGNSINASELSGQSVSVKNAGSYFEVETLNSYSSSKVMGYSANYVNGLNTYSTTETRVGTWINGKPLYRTVIQFTTATTETALTIDVSSLNIDRLVKLDGTNGTNTDTRPINFFIMFGTTSYYVSARYTGASGSDPDRVLVQYSTAYGGLLSYLILEYTKTTD